MQQLGGGLQGIAAPDGHVGHGARLQAAVALQSEDGGWGAGDGGEGDFMGQSPAHGVSRGLAQGAGVVAAEAGDHDGHTGGMKQRRVVGPGVDLLKGPRPVDQGVEHHGDLRSSEGVGEKPAFRSPHQHQADPHILGEAQQTFFKALRDDRIGKPLVVYSAMNWGRLESWHGNASAFYTRGVGPLFDVGVYALTVLTTAFGPVKRVTGFGGIQQPRRVQQTGPREGESFYVETPDVVISGLEFESGVIGRLTASFLVGGAKDGSGTEVHGESGALYLGSNHDFNCAVEIQSGGSWAPLEYVAEPFGGVEWGRAVFDLADSLRTGSPQRATGRQALHVLDVCVSTLESIEHGHPVSTTTHFEQPAAYYE